MKHHDAYIITYNAFPLHPKFPPSSTLYFQLKITGLPDALFRSSESLGLSLVRMPLFFAALFTVHTSLTSSYETLLVWEAVLSVAVPTPCMFGESFIRSSATGGEDDRFDLRFTQLGHSWGKALISSFPPRTAIAFLPKLHGRTSFVVALTPHWSAFCSWGEKRRSSVPKRLTVKLLSSAGSWMLSSPWTTSAWSWAHHWRTSRQGGVLLCSGD